MSAIIFAKRLQSIFIFILKILVLVLLGVLAANQLPELHYDLGPRKPVQVLNPTDLTQGKFQQSSFVAVHGRANFEYAFTYRRYGLSFTYFTLEPYGLQVVARTHDQVTDEWVRLDRFIGRLRPFAKQPFSYRIQEIFSEKMGIVIPSDAYFLALDDVPKPSGWQIGALIFALLLWISLFYLFFIFRGRLLQGRRHSLNTFDHDKKHPAGNAP